MEINLEVQISSRGLSPAQAFRLPEKSHLLVGFHDNSGMHPSRRECLALAVDEIDRPPVAGDRAVICRVDTATGGVVPITETDAWNFPQGARQHYINGGENILFNRREGDRWVAISRQLQSGNERILAEGIYAVSPDGKTGIGLNFARLHRLGGYGYVGLADYTAGENVPAQDGLWEVNLRGEGARLLVSIREVCAATEQRLPTTVPHYLTHVVYAPSGKRFCFLHRYWLPDGGIFTRLMVCDANGANLQCRAQGYLSHFDWLNEETILIWGKAQSGLQASRNHPFLRLPGIRSLATIAKPALKKLLGRKAVAGSYMLIGPRQDGVHSFAPELLREDGHPSFRPPQRDWLLTDTYPNKEGWRTLMVLPVASPKIHILGRYREMQAHARQDRLAEAMSGIDPLVQRSFKPATFAHTRSGLHCDFHPRWCADGRAVCFDSNHDGRRAVYFQDVGSVIDELAV